MELMMYKLRKVSTTHRIHSLHLHAMQDFNSMGVREAYQRIVGNHSDRLYLRDSH